VLCTLLEHAVYDRYSLHFLGSMPGNLADSNGKTYIVPKGDICCTSPCVQHRAGSLFKNPDAYDHTRFLEPREEDKKAKFTFIGFGGGRHGCMGTNFAYLQIKTVRCALY
jgi:sterol 14-demethylase